MECLEDLQNPNKKWDIFIGTKWNKFIQRLKWYNLEGSVKIMSSNI